eukprot:356126-Chlamydomonas_euryale.AAC.7
MPCGMHMQSVQVMRFGNLLARRLLTPLQPLEPRMLHAHTPHVLGAAAGHGHRLTAHFPPDSSTLPASFPHASRTLPAHLPHACGTFPASFPHTSRTLLAPPQTVGIDYLSIARYSENSDAHVHVLVAHIMVVEGLVLDEAQPGWYTMACLPLKVAGVEGVPARCVLGAHAPRGGGTSAARGEGGDCSGGGNGGGGRADVGEHYYYYYGEGAYYGDGDLAGVDTDLRERMGYDPDDDDDAARYWGDYDSQDL